MLESVIRKPAALPSVWTVAAIESLFDLPFNDLLFRAQQVHREHHDANAVQRSTLMSIKTGGCSEDCGYCSQSARHGEAPREALAELADVVAAARAAKDKGASRFCMGAAWRGPKDKDLDRVAEMVSAVKGLGMETCVTLGMLKDGQAERLKQAGLDYYNHNLDTSEENYEAIISTRTYDDRLETIENVNKAEISVCSGGIIGLGESEDDRIGMLHTLATLPKHPESVPVNALVPVKGTPLESNKRVSVWEMIRMIATARIVMPKAMVRLSAGRNEMSVEEQALCFMAGANSIFAGEKLLTTPNPDADTDKVMFELLGLTPRPAYKEELVS